MNVTHYAQIDADGLVLAGGSTPAPLEALAAAMPHAQFVRLADPLPAGRWRWAHGALQPAVAPDGPEPDYRARRAMAYPPLTDQLDAVFKGGEALEDMRARVLAVKAAHPKP